MIPYDDLVVALTTWRARQGLPVGQLSAQLTPPPAPPSAQYAAVAAPAPTTSGSGSGGTRPAPPPPRGNTGARAAVPPPLESPTEDSLDVDDAALLEESENDFAMQFPAGAASRDTVASLEHEPESTAIGSAPLRDSYGGETMLDGELEGDDALAPMTTPKPKPPTW